MSRSADGVQHGQQHSRDGGFSLVEIVVALGVLMVVVVALLPQLIVGIRSIGTARLVTQAKGVVQGELERMRNLPFFISPAAGDYRDVLDYYYRNLTPPAVPAACTTTAGKYAVPQAGWAGYVSETGARCAYEPATGAFYRAVRQVPATPGIASFTIVVDTLFLSDGTPPVSVTPRTGYDTQSTLGAQPSSQQIGVTVTALNADRETLRPVSTSTQIADRPSGTTRLRGDVNVTAIDVGSVTSANGPVTLVSGLLNLSGSLSYASTVKAHLSGTSAGLSTGEQASGATAIGAAPPVTGATGKTASPGSLVEAGCDFACWGSTRLEGPGLSAEQGLPNAGSLVAPMRALVTDKANNGISFGNSAATAYRPELSLTPPLLKVDPTPAAIPLASGIGSGCVTSAAGTPSFIAASGYVRSDSSTVEACAVARTLWISIFPTTFAPNGVVLIELRRASAQCLVQGAAHSSSATHDYEAELTYWTAGTAGGPGHYRSAGIVTPLTTTDPLDSVDLATPVDGLKVLGDYVASWSMLTATEVLETEAAGVAKVKLPGVVTIQSQPVRQDATLPGGDPTSVMSVAVGALSCSAQDAR